jgi:hypothetical protein
LSTEPIRLTAIQRPTRVHDVDKWRILPPTLITRAYMPRTANKLPNLGTLLNQPCPTALLNCITSLECGPARGDHVGKKRGKE